MDAINCISFLAMPLSTLEHLLLDKDVAKVREPSISAIKGWKPGDFEVIKIHEHTCRVAPGQWRCGYSTAGVTSETGPADSF